MHGISSEDFHKDSLVKKWLSRYPTYPAGLYLNISPMLVTLENVDIYDLVTARAIPSTKNELGNDTRLISSAISSLV